jgi:hypothetical protein
VMGGEESGSERPAPYIPSPKKSEDLAVYAALEPALDAMNKFMDRGLLPSDIETAV